MTASIRQTTTRKLPEPDATETGQNGQYPVAKAEHLDDEDKVRDEPRLVKTISDLARGWACPEGALALAGAWGN